MATQAMMELEEHAHGPEAAVASGESKLPHDDPADQRLFSDDEEEEEADEHEARREIDDIVECSQYPPDAILQQLQQQDSPAPVPERSPSPRITLASLFTPPSTQAPRQQRAATLSPQPTVSCGSVVLRPAIRPPSCHGTTDQLLQLGVPPVVVSCRMNTGKKCFEILMLFLVVLCPSSTEPRSTARRPTCHHNPLASLA